MLALEDYTSDRELFSVCALAFIRAATQGGEENPFVRQGLYPSTACFALLAAAELKAARMWSLPPNHKAGVQK